MFSGNFLPPPPFYLLEEFLVLKVMHGEKLWFPRDHTLFVCSLVQQEYQVTISFLRSSAATNSSPALSLLSARWTSAPWFLSETNQWDKSSIFLGEIALQESNRKARVQAQPEPGGARGNLTVLKQSLSLLPLVSPLTVMPKTSYRTWDYPLSSALPDPRAKWKLDLQFFLVCH